MNKRLAFLEGLVQSGKADAFARYGLALEYKKEGRVDDAVAAFEALRSVDAAYVPQYLMAGTMLSEAGRVEEARAWFESGVAAARAAGNSHALSELTSALEAL